jgi:hypothetical protein
MTATRVIFPFRGAADRPAYISLPGDTAPVELILNVRPQEAVAGRERGGQRPGLVEITDPAGVPWGAVGSGPIQAITSIARPAEVVGFSLGACVSTHQRWESRESEAISGNVYTLRGRGAKLSLSRFCSVGAGSVGTARQIVDVRWSGPRHLVGGMNENPITGANESIVWRNSITSGLPNNGFGSPEFTAYANFDPNDGTVSVTGGPWPMEEAAVFYRDVDLGLTLFAAHSITALSPPSEPNSKGYIVAYNLATAGLATVTTGVNYIRPDGVVYNESTPGTPSTLAEGSIASAGLRGAREVTGLVASDLYGQRFLYFCYHSRVGNESMVGRFNVRNFHSTGFDLSGDLSGAFQINGAGFAVQAGNFVVPTSALDPHFLSVNYPRAGRPMGVAIDPLGYVYWVQSSAGTGPNPNPAGPGYRPEYHPDYPGHKPVTVCKVDPEGTRFEWEAETRKADGDGWSRINDPELIWVQADERGCYVGGRRVRGASVFGINGDSGNARWTFDSGGRAYDAALDPQDGNLWVVGERNTAWAGAAGRAANIWKLDRDSGAVLIHHDLGPSVNVLSIDINRDTGEIVVGTVQTDTP